MLHMWKFTVVSRKYLLCIHLWIIKIVIVFLRVYIFLSHFAVDYNKNKTKFSCLKFILICECIAARDLSEWMPNWCSSVAFSSSKNCRQWKTFMQYCELVEVTFISHWILV